MCLFDAEGPCGNAVKDAQRTKTSADTRRTLSAIWSSNTLGSRAAEETLPGMLNSFLAALGTAALNLVLGTLTGYSLARYRFRPWGISSRASAMRFMQKMLAQDFTGAIHFLRVHRWKY